MKLFCIKITSLLKLSCAKQSLYLVSLYCWWWKSLLDLSPLCSCSIGYSLYTPHALYSTLLRWPSFFLYLKVHSYSPSSLDLKHHCCHQSIIKKKVLNHHRTGDVKQNPNQRRFCCYISTYIALLTLLGSEGATYVCMYNSNRRMDGSR